MTQFAVHRLAGGALVVDLQSDFADTGFRVVAPLTPVASRRPITRLEPLVRIEDDHLAIRTSELAALPARLLGEPVADLSSQADAIKAAVDLVFYGF